MRERPSARLLIVDDQARLLLFHFAFENGHTFWATPGGSLEPGESFEDAARRELLEETGLRLPVGAEIHRRDAVIRLPDGDEAHADERFFLVRAESPTLATDGWTDEERRVMVAHRWWTQGEFAACTDQVWPENLVDVLRTAGVWPS